MTGSLGLKFVHAGSHLFRENENTLLLKVLRMIDEGYIKFSIERIDGDDPEFHDELVKLNGIRTKLFHMGLIGILDNGIGFGNVSIRDESRGGLFVISGSGTGGQEVLENSEYCTVLSTNVAENSLVCTGNVNASSESMSHAVVYEANDNVMCVIHVHNLSMFDYMLENSYPQTPVTAAYGTPEIAFSLKEKVMEVGSDHGIVVMAGHQDGVIAYGPGVEDTFNLIDKIYSLSKC